MEINSHKLKLNGTVELTEPLEEGSEYHVSVVGTVNNSSVGDNEDGTWDKTWKIKISTLELLDNKGQVIKGKDRTKQSLKVRKYLYMWGTENEPDMDEEELYKLVTNGLMVYGDRVIPYIIKLMRENAY